MKNASILTIIISLCFISSSASAQGLIDGFFKKKGEIGLALSYTYEYNDQFYVGTEKMDLPPFLGELKTESTSLFLAYGVEDNLTLITSIPYITVRANGDPTIADLPPQKVDGFQKAAVFAKWKAWEKEMDAGTLSAIGAGGIRLPLSSYDENIPTGIGHRSSEFELNAGLDFKSKLGIFANAIVDYTIKTGENPQAIGTAAKVGYYFKYMYIDAWAKYQYSFDGQDIGTEGFSFPGTQVNYMRLGATVAGNLSDRLSIFLSGGTTLSGRNLSDTNWISVGVATNFGGKVGAL